MLEETQGLKRRRGHGKNVNEKSVFRPIGVIGGGLTPLMAFAGSIFLLLVLLRYVSIRLIPSDQDNIKEVSMKKSLTVRSRVFLSYSLESIWAIGVSSVASHLSA